MEGQYILAVDGGQSSTVCVLGAADGTLLGAGFGGPCNHVRQPGGAERMRSALAASIGGALSAVCPPPDRVAAAFLGLTGGLELAREIMPGIVTVDRLAVESDALAGLASGTHGGPGVALIAGTGAVSVAQRAPGERISRGGWGYLVGDEGSGYWIGMQCIRAAARAEDGRGRATALHALVLHQLGAPDLRTVAARLYADEIGRNEIATLAPLALRAADMGDLVAENIVEQAAEELAVLAEATCAAAGLWREDERVLVPVGGVLRPGNALWRRLVPRLQARLPGWRVAAPSFPPVVGAFLLGLRLAGVEIDAAVLAQVSATLAAIPEIAAKGSGWAAMRRYEEERVQTCQ